jgi:hypothetical protein
MFAFSSVCLKILFFTNCTYCSCVAGGAVGVVQCARKTGVYAWAFGKRFFVVGVRKAPKARQVFKSGPFGVIGTIGANRTFNTLPVQIVNTCIIEIFSV